MTNNRPPMKGGAMPRPPDEVRLSVGMFELRDAEAVGAGRIYRYLHGRAVPYDEWTDLGDFMESFAAGSFEQSTRAGSGRGKALLAFHKRDVAPVGTAETWLHGDGLDGVWRLSDSAEAQQLARSAADGALGLSVGFQPIRDRLHQKAGGRDWIVREECRLMETSLVSVPAYEGAQVTLVRSAYVPAVELEEPAAPLAVDAWRDYAKQVRSAQP